MKKIVCVGLLISLVFALTACGGGEVGKVYVNGTETTLGAMANEFEDNDVAATEKYCDDKEMVIIDRISSIEGPTTYNGHTMQAYLNTKGGCIVEVSKAVAASLNKGDIVKIEGCLFNYFTKFQIYIVNGHDVKVSLYKE